MDLKGIGEKNAALFHKLNIETVEDLLYHFPREYMRYPKAGPHLKGGNASKQAILASVKSLPTLTRMRGTSLLKFQVVDSCGQMIWVSFYHMPYLKNTIKPGKTHVFYGNVYVKNGMVFMSHPKMYDPAEYQKLEEQLVPVYTRTKGLTDQTIYKHCMNALRRIEDMEEYLPQELQEKYAFLPAKQALEKIHAP